MGSFAGHFEIRIHSENSNTNMMTSTDNTIYTF